MRIDDSSGLVGTVAPMLGMKGAAYTNTDDVAAGGWLDTIAPGRQEG